LRLTVLAICRVNLRAFYQGMSAPPMSRPAQLHCREPTPKSFQEQGFLTMQSAETGQSSLWHGTTILTVRKGGLVAIGGDGQVSIGQTIVKANAKKVRRLGKGEVIGWNRSSSSMPDSSCVPPSNWPRTGVPTATYAGSKP
jgi:hypothetical protein